MQLSQICRLCLEEKISNETVLVEIFSSYVNEPGKTKLSDKINSISGLMIRNDGLPTKVCHKCVVSINSFYEYKKLILESDSKLRQFLNLNGNDNEEEMIENHRESDDCDENEIIKLDPNKVYESSEDESDHEIAIETNKPTAEIPIFQKEEKIESIIKKPCNASTRDKMEIFHCKYCDVVFSDMNSCVNHELNHDQINPYECNICSFKANQHQHLIIHIKHEHKVEKPFFCVCCSKSFHRRSDLRKHIFVHAGIRLFSCNLCQKSFTRSTNLAKHKRTHLDIQKNFKCSLCPKAFISNAELSTHMEIHMTRNTFNCKYCNQVFVQRDELEIHQKSHIAQIKPQPSLLQPQQPASIVFYNQNPLENQQTGMNFYKESVEMQQQQQQQPQPQPKIEYPIMNQLLSNFNSHFKCDKCIEQFPTPQQLQNHQSLYHSKNFSCSLCSCSYYKKKELDRHILSAHTDIKYNCSKCNKSFSRKDKLSRHEKTHLVPSFFNCAWCPAVFVRKNLLELHSKIHMMPTASNSKIIDGIIPINFEQQQQQQQQPQLTLQEQPPVKTSESFMPTYVKQPSPLDLSPMKMIDQPAVLYPMNLTMNQMSEPMDLSNEKNYNENESVSITKIEPPKIVIESDDDDLKIIENNDEITKHNNDTAIEITPKTEHLAMTTTTTTSDNFKSTEIKEVNEELARFSSLKFDLDKMEPTKDLPMEILQSPII